MKPLVLLKVAAGSFMWLAVGCLILISPEIVVGQPQRMQRPNPARRHAATSNFGLAPSPKFQKPSPAIKHPTNPPAFLRPPGKLCLNEQTTFARVHSYLGGKLNGSLALCVSSD